MSKLIKELESLKEENAKLKEAIKNLVDATEDKGGQFRAWHQHLRDTTKAAKQLIS